jgi:hypothetical protein
MPDPTTAPAEAPAAAPATSPTGAPLLSPAAVRWLLPFYLILSGSGLTLMLQLDVSDRALAVYGFIVASLGALLGQASPGIRRAAPLALLLLALPLAGCRTIPPPVRDGLVDCGSDAIRAQLPGVVVTVDRIIGGAAPDWNAQLDQLLINAGDVVICAVRVVVANLLSTPNGDPTYAAPYGVPPAVSIERGEKWLAAHERPAAAGAR